MANRITERQREILLWIAEYAQANWRPPTVQEIGDHFGVKPSSAYAIVQALREKKYLAEGDGTARCLLPGLLWKLEVKEANGDETEK